MESRPLPNFDYRLPSDGKVQDIHDWSVSAPALLARQAVEARIIELTAEIGSDMVDGNRTQDLVEIVKAYRGFCSTLEALSTAPPKDLSTFKDHN